MSILELRSRLNRLDAIREERETAATNLMDAVTTLMEEGKDNAIAKKILSFLMERMTQKDMAEMDNLVTYGLRAVFKDRDITFKSNLKDSGKKFTISLDTFDGGQEVAGDAFGSVAVIESFLLRLLTITKLKKPHIIILDETFSSVDQNRINHVGPLISELCKRMGFDVLLVTHNPGASDHKVLQAELVNSELTLRKIDKRTVKD